MEQLHGLRLSVSKTGIATVRVPFYADNYADISNVPRTFIGTSGGSGLALTNIEATQAEEGLQYVVTATYEGLVSGGEEAGPPAGDMAGYQNKVYEWRPSESETALKGNPNFELLKQTYNGTYNAELDAIVWGEMTDKKGRKIENPMKGIESWLDMFGEWTETEAVKKIPSNIFEGVWSIVDKVPGGFPTPPDRMWLVMPPSVSHRGNCYEIQRRWKMTGVMTPEALEATRMIYTPIK